MKKYSTTTRVIAVFAASVALTFAAASAAGDYVAHEWGTFTSLQGGNGDLILWKPLETSVLPGFVYNSEKAGLNRMVKGLGKGSMLTLQRMETPVIYFYTETEQTIDVQVKFPKGLVTEWYPQAKKIGPSFAVKAGDTADPIASFIPNYAGGVTVSNEFTSSESLIHWPEVKLIPTKMSREMPLPLEKSGNHYFAARETDSALVRLNAAAVPEIQMEQEKFLFYRGVGSFKTPLRVTISSSGALTLENQGKETLAHLFFLKVEKGAGKFIHIEKIKPNTPQTIEPNLSRGTLAMKNLQEEISVDMQRALVSEGLYPREAAAMVNTWKDSWFTENGWRMLYTLPREWTDGVLPAELNPPPSKFVRVMVGRSELIPPAIETELAAQIKKALQGNPGELQASLKKLGRFSESFLFRALAKANPSKDDYAKVSKIFQESIQLASANGRDFSTR